MRNFKKYDNRNLYNIKKGRQFFTYKNQKNKLPQSAAQQVKNKIKVSKFLKDNRPLKFKKNSFDFNFMDFKYDKYSSSYSIIGNSALLRVLLYDVINKLARAQHNDNFEYTKKIERQFIDAIFTGDEAQQDKNYSKAVQLQKEERVTEKLTLLLEKEDDSNFIDELINFIEIETDDSQDTSKTDIEKEDIKEY